MKRSVIWAVAVLLACASSAAAQAGGAATSIGQRTAGLQRGDGFIPFYLDARGRLLLEISRFDEDVLYFISTAQSAGSVELGLDRGVDEQKVIHFHRVGPRVHVIEQNLAFRALDGSEAAKRNVADSFATSILASLPVEAEEGGRVLVDATPLLIRDATGIAASIRQRNQGTFRLDESRSSIYPDRTKAFPENTEVEVFLTFAGENPGVTVSNVTPEPTSLTMRTHHSFVQAPTGYTPRVADPRIGNSTISFKDYSVPFNRDTDVRWIRRWRLEKKDPNAAISEPVEPITFYVDLAIPEPVRSVMKEGFERWNMAFEKAGFRNAVRAADPTPDMDPLDIRHAWLLWIDRDERGFSSGGNYSDPRTGEILGAKTRMDSWRIRTMSHYWQSYQPTDDDCAMYLPPFEDLLAAFQQAGGASVPPEQNIVLARQALLTLHETGHALGFGHNWNSSMQDRASVMEYPTPRVKVTPNGGLDLSEAFRAEPGEYDVMMVRYAYTIFPEGKEREGLDAIVREMRQQGLLFTPSDDPRWNWYDDLASPDEYLWETMAARKIMLERYGPALLRTGEPLSDLRDMRLWMAYMHHRWAIEAGLKYLGSEYHNTVLKGEEGVKPVEPVPGKLQRDVLAQLMDAIQPANLAIPDSLIANLVAPVGQNDLEDIADDYVFDHLRAARILSALVLEPLFDPQRAARLIVLGDRYEDALTLPEVVRAVAQATWDAPADTDPRHRALRRVTQRVALDSLMMLGANPNVTPEARAVVFQELVRLQNSLGQKKDQDPVTEAHLRQAERDIARFLEDPEGVAPDAAGPTWGRRPRSRYPGSVGPPL